MSTGKFNNPCGDFKVNYYLVTLIAFNMKKTATVLLLFIFCFVSTTHAKTSNNTNPVVHERKKSGKLKSFKIFMNAFQTISGRHLSWKERIRSLFSPLSAGNPKPHSKKEVWIAIAIILSLLIVLALGILLLILIFNAMFDAFPSFTFPG